MVTILSNIIEGKKSWIMYDIAMKFDAHETSNKF